MNGPDPVQSEDLRRQHLQFTAEPLHVRDTLARATGWLGSIAVSQSDIDRAELVLAEILNNIAEHAYVGREPGPVDLWLDAGDKALTVQVEDRGHRLPGDNLPPGNLPSHDTELDDLPEGGFGWFLVFSLTEDLSYYRNGDRNIVNFVVPYEPWAENG